MSGDRFTGRLVSSYTVTLPAQPGWAQHARHREDAAGGVPDRDDAPSGGGWQPDAWTADPTTVLPGYSLADATDGRHRRAATHLGDEARGAGQRRNALDSLDRNLGGDEPGLLLGAGGAANGGLRAEGSAPWMNPGASRRRADGGLVTRAAGFLLGHRHVTVKGEHRQGLHMNQPTLRPVREKRITKSTEPSLRTVGPIVPQPRRTAPPYTAAPATVSASPAQPSVIGGGWAL